MAQDEETVSNLAKKIGSIGTMIAIANMNNSLGGFVKNQLNVAMRYEEEKVLKEKFGKEMEELNERYCIYRHRAYPSASGKPQERPGRFDGVGGVRKEVRRNAEFDRNSPGRKPWGVHSLNRA